MGCCGCDNRSSANTAGIFAIIQCIVGISLTIYNLNIYNDTCINNLFNSKGYICYVLSSDTGTIRALLIVALILYILWAISSVILLVGNAQNKAGFVTQWVVLSTVVILCDIIFPVIIAVTTYSTIMNMISSSSNPYDYNSVRRNVNTGISADDASALSWNYIALILAFSRGGLITWCCDIALTVFTSRRATEIRNPPRTFVLGQAVPSTTFVSTTYPAQYIQQGFVSPQQGYVAQQPNQGYWQTGQYGQSQPLYQPQSDNFGPPPTYSRDEKQQF